MVTDEQGKILDMLCKPKKKFLKEDDYDKLGLYGGCFCSIDYDDDYYDDEEEEEEDDW